MKRRILGWYSQHGRAFPWREPEASEYLQLVSELLLQRTRAETVSSRLASVLTVAPNWNALATVKVSVLQEVLMPLGLWQRRANSLQRLAVEIEMRHGVVPTDRSELESLPGIGQYMANAIQVILGGKSAPYLDSNMARILERLFGERRLADIRYDAELQEIAHAMVRSKASKKLNWGILDIAATICSIRQPRCFACPLRESCDYAKNLDRQ